MRGTGVGGPRYPAWLALPAVAWYVLFFLCPLGIMAVYSVSRPEGFTEVVFTFDLENFLDLWDPLYGAIFLRTLALAFFGTLDNGVTGTFTGMVLSPGRASLTK